MEYFIGFALALASIGSCLVFGIARERSFYATVMIVVASYYVLFAVIGGSSKVIWVELVLAAGFVISAVLGFRSSLWIVAAALVGHALLDCFHDHIVVSSAMPSWWPGFCLAYDATAGLMLAGLLLTGRPCPVPARATET